MVCHLTELPKYYGKFSRNFWKARNTRLDFGSNPEKLRHDKTTVYINMHLKADE